MLLLGEHQFNTVPFFWSREASRAVVSYDREVEFVREILEQSLSTSHQWPDNSEVASINRIICFHCPQCSVVETRHDKRLSQII